jgi:hypothetical protein
MCWFLCKICVIFFFLYCCAGYRYIVAFTKVCTMCQLYHTWIHPFPSLPLSPLPWFMDQFQQVIIFAFTCMCTHFFHHTHSPTPFPHLHCANPTPPSPTPPEKLWPLVLRFVEDKRWKEKHDIFAFETKIATWGVSLWYFHACKPTPVGLFPTVIYILP